MLFRVLFKVYLNNSEIINIYIKLTTLLNIHELIEFIYIIITWDQVLLVPLAAHIFVLVARKLFLIYDCTFFDNILQFS